MNLSTDALWRLYPSGSLPVRGVLTVGGWQCVYAGPNFEGLGDDRRQVPGSHAIWRYMTNWELTEHFYDTDWIVPPLSVRWSNRSDTNMGMAAHDFCANGDLLPDLVDPLTRYAVGRDLARRAFRRVYARSS